MDIFHRLDVHNFSTFSVVNAVEPGTFSINSMAEMSTPGISLFMRVHELVDPVAVFNEMVDVAHSLAEELGGEVRDESRSAMTHQTVEHCRLEISEYQLKNRT
jgi:cell division protein ZipA